MKVPVLQPNVAHNYSGYFAQAGAPQGQNGASVPAYGNASVPAYGVSQGGRRGAPQHAGSVTGKSAYDYEDDHGGRGGYGGEHQIFRTQ